MRVWFNITYCISILLLLTLCSPTLSSAREISLLLGDPIVGPRDVLDIQVFNEPTMSMNVVVSASSQFSFPLLLIVGSFQICYPEISVQVVLAPAPLWIVNFL